MEEKTKHEIEIGQFKKTIEDMVTASTIETRRNNLGNLYSDADILNMVNNGTELQMRNISKQYFKISGLYRRTVLYFATMSTYDYLITPKFINPYEKSKKKEFLTNYHKILYYLDSIKIPLEFSRIFANMLIEGVYYGLVINDKNGFTFYDLPSEYCRTQYKNSNGLNILEFDMRYFDRIKRNTSSQTILSGFPRSVQNYYKQYKESIMTTKKLSNWMVISNEEGVAFYYRDLYPFFTSIIPALIDLKDYKGLEKARDTQELHKLLIQKLPLDDNNELVFDLKEAADIHRGIVAMLKNSPSIDVLTTFCEAKVESLQDGRQVVKDNLEKMERSVYNESGISKNLFASDSSVALESSIKNDFALVCDILGIFNNWLNFHIQKKFAIKNEYFFEVNILPISHYNREEMLDLYLKTAQNGFSKILVGIAGGVKQSNIMNIMTLENDILELPKIMKPLKTSATLSKEDALGAKGGAGSGIGNKKILPKKAEKTVKNIEAKGAQ